MNTNYINELSADDIRQFISTVSAVKTINCIYRERNHWLISIIVKYKSLSGVEKVAEYPINYHLFNYNVTSGDSFLPELQDKYLEDINTAWVNFLASKFPEYREEYNAKLDALKI